MSRSRWPLHFGLLNNDCLWVMDEVQLMGPGLWTSGQLDWMRQRRFPAAKPCWTWWVSATQSAGFLETVDRPETCRPERFCVPSSGMPERLREARRPCEAWKPRTKEKGHETAALADAIWHAHRDHTLTLAVCNTVAAAQALFIAIKQNHKQNVILLTSRFRRVDRNENEGRLLEFERQRRKGSAPASGLICIATQLVEAGLDVSATQLWSEYCPWPSLVQRLGRLNRDGSANGAARCWLFELGGEQVGPYEEDALELGKRLTGALLTAYQENPEATSCDALALLAAKHEAEVALALRPKLTSLLRAIDLHGLFDTEPDLFGGFTDVSEFVRSPDPNPDLSVFWREFDSKRFGKRSDEFMIGPSFSEGEAVAVPAFRVREFLKRSQMQAWTWDEDGNRWQPIQGFDLSPGMTVMLPRAAGGYSRELGWTGETCNALDSAEPPGNWDDGATGESWQSAWVDLETHLEDVCREAKAISAALQLDPIADLALRTAASAHDVGKALPKWQDALPAPKPALSCAWAKGPYLLKVRARSGSDPSADVEAQLSNAGVAFSAAAASPEDEDVRCWQTDRKIYASGDNLSLESLLGISKIERAWMAPFRPDLRHEAASALALWHQYFRQGANFPALAIYLAAAHHGRVRTVLRARSKRGQDVHGVATDSPPIPFGEGWAMDFACAGDGCDGRFGPDGASFEPSSPGW